MKIEHKILHQKFARYGASTKEWMRKCVMLLPSIEQYRIWEQKGFGSIYEYAAKLAGMSRDQVNEALRILKKIGDKPELQKVVEEKGLCAVKPIVTIATMETAEFWAGKVRVMSKNTLETYVRGIRAQQEQFDYNFPRTGLPGTAETHGNPYQQAIGDLWQDGRQKIAQMQMRPRPLMQKTLIMQLDPEVADQLEKLKSDGDWNKLMKEFLKMMEAKLEEQKPRPVESESRYIPVRIKKHALTRTKGICSFPGCKRPYEILHHTQRFALEKVHDADRLEPLCKGHERIAHAGLIKNEDEEASQWRLREQPDQNEPKFKIDELVMKYRKFSP